MGCQGSKAMTVVAPEKHSALAHSTHRLASEKLLGVSASKNKEDSSLSTASLYYDSADSSRSTNCTSSSSLLLKQPTLCTDRHELDVMVMEFSCHDSTIGNAVGRNCKHMHWRVGYDRKASPIDINLHVQVKKIHNNEIRIECDGETIFGGPVEHAKTKMIEDVCCQWPLRATIRGISEYNFFEFHPPYSTSYSWFPATVTFQRKDGLFDVTVQEPNRYGQLKDVKYTAVDKRSLREASTGKPLMVVEDSLILEVPKSDPLQATLKLANGEIAQNHFGRPSPPLSAQKHELCFQVSKDRRLVTADVGPSMLANFVSGEVQSVMSDVERLRRRWTFQLGPLAEHTIEITKRYTLGKVITLLVDGEVLVESVPAELGCDSAEWQCAFKFIGECVMDFEVFQTNKDGTSLKGIDNVKDIRRYVHECKVVLSNDWDFASAKLLIDGVCFTDFPVKKPEREELPLALDPISLQHAYGITTPYKVDHSAPSDFMAFTENFISNVNVGSGVSSYLGTYLWNNRTTSTTAKVEL
jgi:hypothetical protein